jgi:diacylglycerol O-acyltransferase
MQDVKAIRAFHGCTINDVVLAAITAGVRDLLLARGEDVTERVVRTLVPVSVRTIGRDGTSGNHVSGLFPELPVALSDPADRLIAIREQMQARKRAHEAEGGEILMALGELTPSVLLALGEHQATAINRHFVQTIATNVPGPRQTLYLAGCELLECFPFVPLGPSMRVSVAILSYGTALNLGVTGDYDHAPDIAILCAGIKRGIAELLATTRPA